MLTNGSKAAIRVSCTVYTSKFGACYESHSVRWLLQLLELLDCRYVKQRVRASPGKAEAGSDFPVLNVPVSSMHAMRGIAGGGGTQDARYSIVEIKIEMSRLAPTQERPWPEGVFPMLYAPCSLVHAVDGTAGGGGSSEMRYTVVHAMDARVGLMWWSPKEEPENHLVLWEKVPASKESLLLSIGG